MFRCALALAFCALVNAAAGATDAKPFSIYVSNERSGDLSVIDGSSHAVVATVPVGKRPRGLHASPDGHRLFVVTSGSPRMAPGVETERAPADKTADGLVTIDTASRKVVERWRVGSDPEEFALSKDGKFAFIANEDDASVSIIDLASGQTRGKVNVSEEPEGVGLNPQTGEVYVTCEEKGEVFVISPDEQRVVAKVEVGGRPRTVAFSPDGQTAYVACETTGDIAVLDAAHKIAARIKLPEGSLPMGTVVSPDGRELYVATGRGNKVAIVETASNKIVEMVPVGSHLYTANGASNDISVIDVKARKEITRIKVGDGPWGIAIVTP
jgi:YVTN family beta-propeller protein